MACNFTNNKGAYCGGGVYLNGNFICVNDCIFTGNTANHYGGGLAGGSKSIIITNCIFNSNHASNYGGGIGWEYAHDSSIIGCIFNGNYAITGGGICVSNKNVTIRSCTFKDNYETPYTYWKSDIVWYKGSSEGSMINCTFNNNNKDNLVKIYNGNLMVDGGTGIVRISKVYSNEGNITLSGISIVVLNNETYYYPPNSNINLTNKIIIKS